MRVAYVCEGAGTLGWGHLGRAYALWEAAPEEVTVVVGRGLAEFQAWSRQRGSRVTIAPWQSAGRPLEPGGGGGAAAWDVVVVDDYFLPDEWIARVSADAPTVIVDDWMRRAVRAAALLNPNLGASPQDYAGSEVGVWLLGAEYAMIRRAVRDARPAPVGDPVDGLHVLVTLGGSDPGGHAPAIVERLTQLAWYGRGGRVTVVLGSSYGGPEPGPGERVSVLRDPRDFVDCCAAADLVICGAGTTSYELALLGRPFIPVALVENQARVAAAWAERGVGRGLTVWQDRWLSALGEDVERLATDHAARARVARAVSRIVDGRGVERVLGAIRRAGGGGPAEPTRSEGR